MKLTNLQVAIGYIDMQLSIKELLVAESNHNYNHCQKFLEHPAICVVFLHFSNLFSDYPISAPPSPLKNVDNLVKNHRSRREERTS